MTNSRIMLVVAGVLVIAVAYLMLKTGDEQQRDHNTLLDSMTYLQQDIILMQETGEMTRDIPEEVLALCQDYFEGCRDPWGQELDIMVWTSKICVTSLGEDGEIGGIRFDEDISFCVERLY